MGLRLYAFRKVPGCKIRGSVLKSRLDVLLRTRFYCRLYSRPRPWSNTPNQTTGSGLLPRAQQSSLLSFFGFGPWLFLGWRASHFTSPTGALRVREGVRSPIGSSDSSGKVSLKFSLKPRTQGRPSPEAVFQVTLVQQFSSF